MLFVDGHNLTFRDDEARRRLLRGDPEGSRRRILEAVRAYADGTRDRALVVFDGPGGAKPATQMGRVRYCFSGRDREADTEILRRIRKHTGRREIRLVTDDRQLAAAARHLGVKTITLKRFQREVNRLRGDRADLAPEPAAKYHGPPPGEVEYWLKIFGDEGADDMKEEPPGGRSKRKR